MLGRKASCRGRSDKQRETRSKKRRANGEHARGLTHLPRRIAPALSLTGLKICNRTRGHPHLRRLLLHIHSRDILDHRTRPFYFAVIWERRTLLLFTHYRAALVASLLHVIHPPAPTMTVEKHTPSETAAALLENVRLLLWNLPPSTPSTIATALAWYGPVSLPTPAGSLLCLSFSWSYCQVRTNRSNSDNFSMHFNPNSV